MVILWVCCGYLAVRVRKRIENGTEKERKRGENIGRVKGGLREGVGRQGGGGDEVVAGLEWEGVGKEDTVAYFAVDAVVVLAVVLVEME